jgi:hypothetical protein
MGLEWRVTVAASSAGTEGTGSVALLPATDHAVIDIAKLRDYALDPDHPTGAHKARVFAAALGLSRRDADEISAAILAAVAREPAAPGARDRFGQRYMVGFVMERGDRRAVVRTAWIILAHEDFPRLVSCYVL